MSLIDDIKAERAAAVATIDEKILDASTAGLDNVVTQLQAERSKIDKAALTAILAAPNLADALDALKKAIKDMNDVAQNMKTAADFAGKLAGFLDKAKAVGDVIKNGGAALGVG